MVSSFSSFRGAPLRREPGIQTRCMALDTGSTRRRVSRNDKARKRGEEDGQKKSRRFRRLLKLITGRRQTEWTGATRCPNRDDLSHIRESLIDRKRTVLFKRCLPCRPLAERSCPGRGAAFFMPLRRAGTVPSAGVCDGPGSATHHAAKSGAIARRR